VRVTLARLRKMGLETAIERGSIGWRLTRDIDIVRSSTASMQDAPRSRSS
jgi:hypothetical protein